MFINTKKIKILINGIITIVRIIMLYYVTKYIYKFFLKHDLKLNIYDTFYRNSTLISINNQGI